MQRYLMWDTDMWAAKSVHIMDDHRMGSVLTEKEIDPPGSLDSHKRKGQGDKWKKAGFTASVWGRATRS